MPDARLFKLLLHHARATFFPAIPVVRHSGPEGSIIVAGIRRWTSYLPGRFFPRGCHQEFLGNVFSWQLPAMLRRHAGTTDLRVARLDELSTRYFPVGSGVRVPEWIRMVADVPRDGAGATSHSMHEDLRRTRNNGLTWRVGRESADLHRHIERDYIPHTRARHGADAFVQGAGALRRAFRRGGVMWIEADGRELASSLFEQEGDTLTLWSVGCAGGDADLMRKGALAAVYQFSFDCARAEGVRWVDMRGCRPSPRDGLFVMKQKWGGVAQRHDGIVHEWLLHWETPNAAVRRFLDRTPLIFRDGDGLSLLESGADAPVAPLPSGLLRRYQPGPSGSVDLREMPMPSA